MDFECFHDADCAFFYFLLHLNFEGLRRNSHGCVAAVDARVLHVLHNGADEHIFSVGDAVNFNFFGAVDEFADDYRMVVSNFCG